MTKIMSKEQTPITAEEFLLQKCGQFVRRSNTQWYELMEQYAQYREKKAVLEALEEVKTHIGKQPKLYPASLWAKLSIMKDEATKQK